MGISHTVDNFFLSLFLCMYLAHDIDSPIFGALSVK